jgi:ADP-ribose pyrophosphatase YjhB (NUDIX family)
MRSNRSNIFCNNCGKQGHSFNQCKKPTISIGIIAFTKKNNTFKYLLICRKDSLGYIDFLRGKYPLYNEKYIQTLIDEMTMDEKATLLQTDFNTLWSQLWGHFGGMNYRNENQSAEDKFQQISRGIKLEQGSEYSLASLIQNSPTRWSTPEWGFPKGRRNHQETDIACAIREWEEETGFDRDSLTIIRNLCPFEEIFMGSNFKTYKHKYYLAYISPDETPEKSYQKSEVSARVWMTLDEALANIRSYNLEKKELITNIEQVLQNYRLIS